MQKNWGCELMSNYQTEGQYTIAENEAGELYIYLKAKAGNPSNPYIVYDGRDHALLVRSPQQTIVLDYINPNVRTQLRQSSQLVIVETLLENINDAYFADVNIVRNLPVDTRALGLKTWEELSLKK